MKILTIKNAKFSEYYFYINLNVWGDFQICISVPLIYMIQLETISVLLNAEVNIAGLTLSKTFCIFVTVIETSTFVSDLNNVGWFL